MTEFITRNHGNKEFEIIIKTDSKEYYKATVEFARRLIDHAKPQTNADRIRAMNDEELAEFLAEVEYRRSGLGGGAVWGNEQSAFKWLKKPVEE